MLNAFRAVALLVVITFSFAAVAQDLKTQPTVWGAKPDVAAFEKMENDRLAAAQSAIDQLVSVKGSAHHREHACPLRRGNPPDKFRSVFFFLDAAGTSRRSLP